MQATGKKYWSDDTDRHPSLVKQQGEQALTLLHVEDQEVFDLLNPRLNYCLCLTTAVCYHHKPEEQQRLTVVDQDLNEVLQSQDQSQDQVVIHLSVEHCQRLVSASDHLMQC